MGRSLRYRAGQFAAALAAAVRPPDVAPARRVLPGPLVQLFERMAPLDQRHGLAVLAALEACGETDAVLLQAALLHDVGKTGAGVTVWHRIARVLLSGPVPPLWRGLSSAPTGWRGPFRALAEHPSRGAEWVESSGGGADLAALIRHHEAACPASWRGTDQGRRHAALAAADGQ